MHSRRTRDTLRARHLFRVLTHRTRMTCALAGHVLIKPCQTLFAGGLTIGVLVLARRTRHAIRRPARGLILAQTAQLTLCLAQQRKRTRSTRDTLVVYTLVTSRTLVALRQTQFALALAGLHAKVSGWTFLTGFALIRKRSYGTRLTFDLRSTSVLSIWALNAVIFGGRKDMAG